MSSPASITDNRVPITLLTGFLGAGKTTLLNFILNGDHNLRIGVLVNDFGAINIDARLVASMDDGTIDLTNGCACCTMRGDMISSVRRMLDRPVPPEHIIIEASGVSDPVAMVAAFGTASLRDRTKVDAVVTVVDAGGIDNRYVDRQLVEDQIRAADLVLLNKSDLVDVDTLAALQERIRGMVPRTRILATVQARAPLDILLGQLSDSNARAMSEAPDQGESVDGLRQHTVPYVSWTFHSDRPLSYRKVRAALETLPPGIIRGKGVLYLADAPNRRFVAQLVGKRVNLEIDRPWEAAEACTQLVFIGTPDAVAPDNLQTIFDPCETDAIPLLPGAAFSQWRISHRSSASEIAAG